MDNQRSRRNCAHCIPTRFQKSFLFRFRTDCPNIWAGLPRTAAAIRADVILCTQEVDFNWLHPFCKSGVPWVAVFSGERTKEASGLHLTRHTSQSCGQTESDDYKFSKHSTPRCRALVAILEVASILRSSRRKPISPYARQPSEG